MGIEIDVFFSVETDFATHFEPQVLLLSPMLFVSRSFDYFFAMLGCSAWFRAKGGFIIPRFETGAPGSSGEVF